MLVLKTGRKVQVFPVLWSLLLVFSCIFQKGLWNGVALMEEGQRTQFLFLFLCLIVCFSLSEIPQLCSFSCYLLASRFPLLWADPVSKWLSHAICGTTVIFLSSSLWCQRPGTMTPWQAPACSKCSSDWQDRAQALDQIPRSQLAHMEVNRYFVSDFSKSRTRLQIACLYEQMKPFIPPLHCESRVSEKCMLVGFFL